jgi:hypothetical protein
MARPSGSDVVQKKRSAYPPLATAFNSDNWSLGREETGKGGSPYRGLARTITKDACPQVSVGILCKLPLSVHRSQLMHQQCGSLRSVTRHYQILRRVRCRTSRVLLRISGENWGSIQEGSNPWTIVSSSTSSTHPANPRPAEQNGIDR